MKQTIITITIAMFCFGWGQSMNPSERLFSQLPQEIQDQLSQFRISWGQAPSRPITPSDRDAEDLYGEWEYVDGNSTMWVTSGTDQTIPNPLQAQGLVPADGAIGIDGPIPGSMNYMMAMSGMYGYDMLFVILSNNSLEENDNYYYYEDSIPEGVILPFYMLEYMSFPAYGQAGGEFIIADTVDGEIVEYYYEFGNVDDQLLVDSTSLRINITDLTLTNDNGDSTYVLSGTLAPGTIDIEAGVPTEISSPMFEEDFGPVSDDESLTWQLYQDGTGLEIISGDDEYYGETWSDTTELEWFANEDSMTMIFFWEDDYYYEEEIDTMTLAYAVENDTLNLNGTMDLCEMMGDDYYYGDCYEMMSMFLGIEDIQEIIMEFEMTMSYSGPVAPEISVVQDTLNFGNVYPGYPDTTNLTIYNEGIAPLIIEMITVSGDGYFLGSEMAFPISITTSLAVPVGFGWDDLGTFYGNLTITSNDSDEATINIPMVSTVVVAPNINVDVESIISILAPGETITDTFYIHNTGGSDLIYDIQTISDGTAGAINLDGSNDGLAVSDNQALDVQNQITIETWVNPSHISQNYPRIVAKGYAATDDGNYGAYELALNGEAGDENAGNAFATLVDANTNEPHWVGSYANIQFDTWTHLATTYDGAYFRFYINGVLHDEYWSEFTISTNNNNLSIGKWFSGNNNSFAGQIDEVRLWDIARTGEEIVSNMNQTLAGNETGLVGYWNFDTDISDQSSYQHQTSSIGNIEIVTSTSPVAGSSFLSVIPALGTVSPGESAMTTYTIQNLEEPGTHTGEILISSNDPDETLIGIPVTIVIESLGNDDMGSLPKEFALYQNYPNPFNPVTTIRFDVVETQHTTSLRIYDITGRMVETLVNEKLEPGQHEIQWNASQHASGVYFLRMNAVSFTKTQKMILLK